MKQKILELVGQKDYTPLNVPELLRRLGLPPGQQQRLQALLRELEQAGRLARIKGNRYIEPTEADLIPGRIRMNRQGKGFLQPDDGNLPEIVVPQNAVSTALHEDRVLVRKDVKSQGTMRRAAGQEEVTGSVIRILERRRTTFVGTLQRSRNFLYVVPDDPRIPHDIYVPEPKDVGGTVRDGDKVVVEMRAWESRHTNPEGEVVEVLGPPDKEGVDMLSVLRHYDLPLSFAEPVLKEARETGHAVTALDREGRVDCREHLVVTIDPDDAKDFDDAIYLKSVSRDQWELWIHIADVSHYVKPGSPLDEEARRRGNSTYLVDRVVPMLPEALSNELCSLKPNVDRLTKCVQLQLSGDGQVRKAQFHSAVIHSKRRLSYQEALQILRKQPEDAVERMLHQAHQLAQRLRRRRFQAGSLNLDFPETKIRLDDKGRIQRIERVENDVSHQLIEEFMLLANEMVAGHLMQKNQPAIYRVHEEPAEKRLQEYREEVLSHDVPCRNLSNRDEVRKLLQRLDRLPIGQALKIGFLKSLMRARYAVEPLGHYGLAKKKYAHFTSPIRRYADLVVHRALFLHSHGDQGDLKRIADHLSLTERNSADAERDSKDVKLYAYLTAQMESGQPEVYSALVTDIRNFGFFVDVPGLGMSGLVHLSSMEHDFFVFDVQRHHLVGRRSRRIIRLGDELKVMVHKVDRFKKQVDFRLAGEAGNKRDGRSSRKGSASPKVRRAKAKGRKTDEERRRRPSDAKGGGPRAKGGAGSVFPVPQGAGGGGRVRGRSEQGKGGGVVSRGGPGRRRRGRGRGGPQGAGGGMKSGPPPTAQKEKGGGAARGGRRRNRRSNRDQ